MNPTDHWHSITLPETAEVKSLARHVEYLKKEIERSKGLLTEAESR